MKPFHKILFTTFLGLLFLISCQNSSELSQQFSCESTQTLHNLESVSDFNKNFSVKLPKHWKTKLYYDNTQSEIFSADTLKSLSQSYIIDFSFVKSPIQISEKLSAKIHRKSMDNSMETTKESFHKYNNKEAYAHLAVGSSKGLPLHVFQYYIKINEESYMLVKSEFYGTEKLNQRLCEAISLINTITIK